jgi:hypothetical protein
MRCFNCSSAKLYLVYFGNVYSEAVNGRGVRETAWNYAHPVDCEHICWVSNRSEYTNCQVEMLAIWLPAAVALTLPCR